MHFMIDYENVRNAGLVGAKFLLPDDKVTLFYSEAAKTIENGYLQAVFEAECQFDICKLIHTGKNALDFYIASRIGQIFGEGFREKVCIVSKDQGFRAIKEYWTECSEHMHTIIIQPTIEKCILAAHEINPRTEHLREKTKVVDISREYAKYEKRNYLKNTLQKLLDNTESYKHLPEIQEIIETGKNKKVIYLNTLHKFGKREGLEVYQKIRECI